MFVTSKNFYDHMAVVLTALDEDRRALEDDDDAITALWKAVANLESVVYGTSSKSTNSRKSVQTPDLPPVSGAKKQISAPKKTTPTRTTKKG